MYVTTTSGQERSRTYDEAEEQRTAGRGSDGFLVTVTGCTISNNTAQLGGGIAADFSAAGQAVGRLLAGSSTESEASLLGPGENPSTHVSAKTEPEGNADKKSPQNLQDLQSLGDAKALQSSMSSVKIVLDAATVLRGNQAAFGGGIWASGIEMSASNGTLLERNVARGLGSQCGDEVRALAFGSSCPCCTANRRAIPRGCPTQFRLVDS